jgi:DNA-binding GntR family transcriptional regulator
MHYLSLNKKSSQPYYLQIEESIDVAIESGVLKHGDKLATVNEIAQFFEISIMAPRKAYELLEVKKKVNSIKGKGTYVNARPHLSIPLENFYKLEHFLPHKGWTLKSYITFISQEREVTELLVHNHLNHYPISFHFI